MKPSVKLAVALIHYAIVGTVIGVAAFGRHLARAGSVGVVGVSRSALVAFARATTYP